VKTLAEFKRYLALTGERPDQKASLRMVSLEYKSRDTGEWVHQAVRNPNFRFINKLQTNSLQFDNGSWLDLPKASEVEFNESESLITITEPTCRMVYKWSNVIILN